MMAHDDDREPPWRRYLRLVRPDARGDVRDELEFHLQSTVDELMAAGLSRTDAVAAARRKFGDVDRITKTLYTISEQRERQMQRSEWFSTLTQDLMFGLRQLRKNPAFTAVAVTTLALGIGANTAIFSVVYSVLLKPLPYQSADRIVRLSQMNGKDTMWSVPFGNFLAWRSQAPDFVDIGATWGVRNVPLTGMGDPEPVPVILASAGYWKTVFAPPVLGRYYDDADDRFGAAPVVVMSEAMWRRRFAADRNVIGRVITLNGRGVRVVGVAPSAYVPQPPQDVMWVPLAPDPARFSDYSDHELTVFGLLKPGVSPSSAASHLAQIEKRIADAHPHSGYDGRITAEPFAHALVGDLRSNLLTLLGAVSLVLLIACGNIANLLLARAAVRRGEIAIRGALGASRGRIVRQLLAESLLLALFGALLGLVVAWVGMRFLVTSPAGIPRLTETTLNLPVLGFTLLIAVACSIVFGLVPAIRAARMDLQQTLRDGGRDSRTALRERLRGALVVGELCIAQVLLIGAGLLLRSSQMIRAIPPGFDTHNLLGASVSLPRARYREPKLIVPTFDQIAAAMAAVPGVKSVGYAQVTPIYGRGWNWTAFREGSNGHDEGAAGADMRGVSPSYFSALGLRLIRGRAFTTADGAGSPPVAIISRGLAVRLFATEDVVGRRISNGSADKPTWKEIVGVADDVHGNGLRDDPFPALYMPATQFSNPVTTFVIRGNVPVTTLVPQLRRAVASVDPLLPLANVQTFEEAIAQSLAVPRFNTWLLGLLGLTGLVLAIVGVYGVISYFVTQRSHEIGVRVALGASGASVQRLIVRQGLALAAIGTAIGVPLALVASRLLRSFVFGISEHDPITYAGVALLLGGVAVAASYVPARRATRIDPLEALRST